MAKKDLNSTTDRRKFIGSIASGAAAMGLATLTPSLNLHAEEINTTPVNPDDPDAWFNQIKGKHRMVFDATHPHEVFPFAWPKVYLLTNASTGTPEKESSAVVVLRHSAIAFAFEDRLWAKYNFAKTFKVEALGPAFQAADANTTLNRNPFWKPKAGDFKLPGLGVLPIGIDELQASGVLFCVCNMAMTVYTNVVAGQMNMKPEDVMKDWMAGLLPGIQVVPSGVWAVGRAQEHGCQYCFTG